ncbi:hypothetical protein NYR66_00090 [Actinobacillus equuli subsp. haemolyticus]|uniref:hypothetical protein n=1 Tax=Actinobacillus equuli TaxID=718 RepID=UPI0024427D08|nr:hypothetical protein [Actinobacillus equuli]WGE81431.1 hypothetical protein NYR66_00090 [Actinobacillus equuli subsp. haemolyticus]
MNKILELLLGIVILVCIGCALYYFIFTWIPNNTTIAIPLISAFIGLIGIIYAQYQSKSRDIFEGHRASKIETYRMFFDVVNLFMDSSKNNVEVDITDPKVQKLMQELNENLILWASDEVLVAWRNFKTSSPNGKAAVINIDKVYRAIRKDLGHNDSRLKELDLIKMNISDPDSLDDALSK